MDLRTLDLNLLLVFDAIHAERSISRAALSLHLSQPTVSNALARLRLRLAAPVRQALDLPEHGLRGQRGFDFASSDREFVIAVEDHGETVILPRFVDWLAKAAPHLRLCIRAEAATQAKCNDPTRLFARGEGCTFRPPVASAAGRARASGLAT